MTTGIDAIAVRTDVLDCDLMGRVVNAGSADPDVVIVVAGQAGWASLDCGGYPMTLHIDSDIDGLHVMVRLRPRGGSYWAAAGLLADWAQRSEVVSIAATDDRVVISDLSGSMVTGERVALD